MRHVYDFIEDPKSDKYAVRWFDDFAQPAFVKMLAPITAKLFATFQGKRYRVTGCSRLGDVWLHADLKEDTTYQLRVDVDACSDWSEAP